ncbi:MAG: DMT family transporter [Anaerolineales bacterium]
MEMIGEFAAVATSLAFAINSTLFTLAGRRVGSVVVNRIRLVFAFLFLALAHWIFLGFPFPTHAGAQRWMWLGLSGIVGLVLGDAFLFQSFVWVGPRIAMLMMSLAPVIAAVIAWVFLGEALSPLQIIAIFVTLGGVIWVVMERNHRRGAENENYVRGVFFGLGGATGQAVGLVLAKNGMEGVFSPISGNFIRMSTALVVMWVVTLLQRKGRFSVQRVLEERGALLSIAGGAFIGPFVGVSLSLLSLQYTEVGIASTLMALSPIFLLPVGFFFFQERFGWGAVCGTAMALAGVAGLFLI